MSALVGHRSAVAAFLVAARSERLHHAWLIAGPQGIGKARFADLAARRLLADAVGAPAADAMLDLPAGHSTAALMDAGSHPDFRRLERLARDKGDELARSIRIDQVRAFQSFLGTTPSLSFRRVIVIDAAEDMERSAANAVLKHLEEPPAGTIFLLVSHAPGRLLPTIRSRCRLLRLGPLADGEARAVLAGSLPHENPAELDALTRIAGGAPGAALRFAGLEIATLDAAIEQLAARGDASNALRAALARSLSGKAAQARYEAFLERAPARIAAAARRAAIDRLAETVSLWRQARDVADRAVRQSNDPQLTVFELAGLVARLAPSA